MKKGKYIVIEGGEGCGKTTQAELLETYLKEKDIPCYFGREPGGIKAAEEMRQILKHNSEDISSITEVFGFEFARAVFFDRIVIPKLEEGINVISDRSGYSTVAYQDYGGGVDIEKIKTLNDIATFGIRPNLGIIIDINPELGLTKEVVKDRFSAKGLEYHKRVREGYQNLNIWFPDNCGHNTKIKVIDYIPNGIEEMQNQIRRYVNELFDEGYISPILEEE